MVAAKDLRNDQRLVRDAHVAMSDRLRAVVGEARPRDFEAWLREQMRLSRSGDREATDHCLAYLALDPFHFRSGYLRKRAAESLASSPGMTAAQRREARELVRRRLRGEIHVPLEAAASLARRVADNQLRRELRAQLHGDSRAKAWMAACVIVRVRHPGLKQHDLAVYRSIVLREAGGGEWLLPAVERPARLAWSGEWAEELLRILDGPPSRERRGARRLLERFTW